MKITVIGLGYVGTVAAAGLSSAGHDVLGVDVDRDKIASLSRGMIPSYEPGLAELLQDGISNEKLGFSHVDDVSESLGEVVFVTTGTPPSETGAADLSQVRSAIRWVKQVQPEGCAIAVKSTVPPGTGTLLQETLLDESAFSYISNPEFLREGQAVKDWFYPDRIVIGGENEEAIDRVKDLYSGFDSNVVVTDLTSAEMIKYGANAFLATKISFINEIATLCDRVGANIDDVSNGIALDTRIGRSYMNAGVGYGGSCFPKDVRALDQLALTIDHNFELLRSVITVNNRQSLLPLHALRKRFGKLSGVEIAVLGIAFKPDTDDIRESPAVNLIRVLTDHGANVRGHDPQAMKTAQRVLPSPVRLVSNLEECIEGAQAIVLMTEWPQFVDADWQELKNLAKEPYYLFDGRNVLNLRKMREYGFEYQGIGRGAAF